MCNFIDDINSLDGLWGFMSLLLAVVASIWGYFIFLLPRKSIRGMNVCFFYSEYVGAGFPKRLYIKIHNSSEVNIIVQLPFIYLKDSNLASQRADKHTPTGNYVIKFKERGDEFYKEGIVLIKPGNSTETFLPMCEDLSFSDISKNLNAKAFPYLFSRNFFACDVILLGSIFKTRRFKADLKGLQDRGKNVKKNKKEKKKVKFANDFGRDMTGADENEYTIHSVDEQNTKISPSADPSEDASGIP